MTGFDSKILRDEPDSYRISFYTDSREAYELIQAACRLCVDAKNTAQATPTAHWVRRSELDDIYRGYYECSRCHRVQPVYHSEDVYEKYPHCTCGCVMKEVT